MGQVVELAVVREQQVRAQARPITKAQVAEHFSVSVRTVTRWMNTGLPYSKPYDGGSPRFNLRDCQDWFTRRR